MKNVIALFLVAILFACDDTPEVIPSYSMEIPPSRIVEAAEFIKSVCEKSNPKSDEEPEDMIEQAENTALRIFGVKKLGANVSRGNGRMPEFVPLEKLSKENQEKCLKWERGE